jgi:hypothetical protein
MAIDPKLQFDKLKGFPSLNDNEKIRTELFLESSNEIVAVIGKSDFSYQSGRGFVDFFIRLGGD